MGTNLSALEALRGEIAELAGLRIVGDRRRRTPVWEWLAAELRFVAAAIPLLARRRPAETLSTLSRLALPVYLEGFGAEQRRSLLARALEAEDAWWQRWEAPAAQQARGKRGNALALAWSHPPLPWEDVCSGARGFADLRLGPYTTAPTGYGVIVELRLVPVGGSGLVRFLPRERTLLRLPGVAWPATIEASIVRTRPLGQVGIVLDIPTLRWRRLPRAIPSAIQDGPLHGTYGHVVAGMSPTEMAVLIAAQMERGVLLSGPDGRRAELLVEELVRELWPHALGAAEDHFDTHALARTLWRRIVAWPRRPLRAGSVPRYVRLSLGGEIQRARAMARCKRTP